MAECFAAHLGSATIVLLRMRVVLLMSYLGSPRRSRPSRALGVAALASLLIVALPHVCDDPLLYALHEGVERSIVAARSR